MSDNLERMQYMPGSSLIVKDIRIDEQVPLFSDKYRLSVIFNNIISNAIKYYDDHKEDPFLRISITIKEESVHMEFEDNGIGIDPEYLNKVFDMFFRATPNNEGAGLGLYIVQEAVDKLRGTVQIKSQLRKGTNFIIDIPNYPELIKSLPAQTAKPEKVQG